MIPLLLLPGMMCDTRLYTAQITSLGRTRCLQLPSLTAHDSMQALADAVLADAPPRFALAGLSMGGILAMEVMARAPERISHLALLDTNPLAEQENIQARRGPQIEQVNNGELASVMREQMMPYYFVRGQARPELEQLCLQMALDLGPAVFERQSLALRDRPDQQETLRRVRVPTLILCGREDRLCPLERHQLMHELIPGSELVVLEDTGHLPCLERPEETSAALARWLSRPSN